MSHRLISHNPDLKKLRDEGYEVAIRSAHLIVTHVPYVNSRKAVAWGTLVAPIGNMAGDKIGPPHDHTIHFGGETPCDREGNPLRGLINSSQHKKLVDDIEVDHYFSAKPLSGNYPDFYEKVTTYVKILSAHAESIDPSVSAKTFRVVEVDDPDSVFNYCDTNSSRAEIEAISSKLKNLKIAIIGLGGTGSYVLDFVAKTPVKEIHLYDGDNLLSHNAFRAPGAPSIELLRMQPRKVIYLRDQYSNIHKGIIPHEHFIDGSTFDELVGMDFAFICIDQGGAKKAIVYKLIEASIPFVDTGMGVDAVDERLRGSVRVTTGTKTNNQHINGRISLADAGDDYKSNIQIAELNALNGAFAVIKWKKLFGFYQDLGAELNTTYNIDINQLLNEDQANTQIR